jgi:sn-glycerol 3-phosphate transport system permease protein
MTAGEATGTTAATAITETSGPVSARRPPRTRRSQRRREAMLGYLLVSPALLVFGVFVFYPFAKNFQLALYRNPPFPNLPKRYVGLEQAGDVLGSDEFRESVWTTVVFALMSVPAGIFLGLALAVAAHRRLRGIGIYRTIFASTVTSSVAVAAVIFGTLFNPVIGWLPALGFSPDPPVLQNPDWALPGVALVSVWQNIGLSFIVMSAGLQAIPDELLEAAEIDGARPWRRFWRVTVPLMSPTIFFAIVVGSIFAFQAFGQIDLLTPSNEEVLGTNVLTYYIFTTLRERQDPGVAAVLAIALFVITLLLTLAQMRILEKRVHYAS